MKRCPWTGNDPLYIDYHDREWGVPVYDDQQLFALLILEGAQAGLSWITILRKRQQYFSAFDGLDPQHMAAYDDARIEKLMQNPGIVRNRRKVTGARQNAWAYLELQEKSGSFSDWLWDFVDGHTIHRGARSMEEVPASTDISLKISKELKHKGFTFCGPTIVYALMQSAGLVNDHLVDCFRYQQIRQDTISRGHNFI